MSKRPSALADRDTITVRVPIAFRRRGGRKTVTTPDGSRAFGPAPARVESALITALARAFRWRRDLETGIHATIDEIATTEKINPSYVSRVLRMILLAPDIVESILDGRQPDHLVLARAKEPFPVSWPEQRAAFRNP